MLQQTRVETVIPYYHRFLDHFPTVYDLAEADQQEVLKCWEGLGYYSRGRNLHQAAKTVVEEFDGELPSTFEEIQSLKGIGPYTASAILSIAFDKKHAVVDGNVIRVISRIRGIAEDVRLTTTKNQIQEIANKLIPEENPGDFNQAVMELGATICKPRHPECIICPVSAGCTVAHSAQTEIIPYKSPAKKLPHHEIAVGLIVNSEDELLIALRPNESMLGGLWEFPGGKKEKGESLKEALARELREELGVDTDVHRKFHKLKHAYSHFRITLHAYWCTITEGDPEPRTSQEIQWVNLQNIERYPFPKANKTLILQLRKLKQGTLRENFTES